MCISVSTVVYTYYSIYDMHYGMHIYHSRIIQCIRCARALERTALRRVRNLDRFPESKSFKSKPHRLLKKTDRSQIENKIVGEEGAIDTIHLEPNVSLRGVPNRNISRMLS